MDSIFIPTSKDLFMAVCSSNICPNCVFKHLCVDQDLVCSEFNKQDIVHGYRKEEIYYGNKLRKILIARIMSQLL